MSYLDYIPILFANSQINAIALTFAPAVLYAGAAYGHLLFGHLTLALSILVSVIFATLEYIVRVPIIKYSSEVAGMSNSYMQVIWIVLTLITSYISGLFMPKVSDENNSENKSNEQKLNENNSENKTPSYKDL